MKVILLLLGLACLVQAQCPTTFYGAPGAGASGYNSEGKCACLDVPPAQPVCQAPFQRAVNGVCQRNPILTALVTVDDGSGPKQKLVYVGPTNSDATGDDFVNMTTDPFAPLFCIASDPITGDLMGVTTIGSLFRFSAATNGLQYYTLSSSFFTMSSSGNKLTSCTYANHSFFLSTYADGIASIWELDTSVGSTLTGNQIFRSREPHPFTDIHLYYPPIDSSQHITLYAVCGSNIIGIEFGGSPLSHVAVTHFNSKLTTGGTATTSTTNTTVNGAVVTGTTTDTLGNVYYTQGGLANSGYAIQKILAANVGTNPTPTQTLSSKTAASVTTPVIDKYNNLYWAAGSSSSSLSGIFVCSSVATSATPVCGASSVYKWPITAQQSGTTVTVTCSQIVYG